MFGNEISGHPEVLSGTTVFARFIDGLAFRYHWATDGLRSEDCAFRPSADSMNLLELQNLERVVEHTPSLLLDNGADLAALALLKRTMIVGGTEETTTGANRLREELSSQVKFPVIVINDSL